MSGAVLALSEPMPRMVMLGSELNEFDSVMVRPVTVPLRASMGLVTCERAICSAPTTLAEPVNDSLFCFPKATTIISSSISVAV